MNTTCNTCTSCQNRRNGATCASCNNCNSCNTCTACQQNARLTSRGCGALRALGRSSCNCNAEVDLPTTCAGYPLYYTGPCAECTTGCPGFCYKWQDCPYPDDPTPVDPTPAYPAGEFTAAAPQILIAGGAFTFAMTGGDLDDFSVTSVGIVFNTAGRYIVSYTFAAPAGVNDATTLALTKNSAVIPASQVYLPVAAQGSARTAYGQALVTAAAGDVLNLISAVALSIPVNPTPVATILIHGID